MPMPRSSASRGLREVQPLAAPVDLARVGLDDAGEDLEQRRLAGAVFSDQAVRFPFGDGERDAAQRRDGAERLADIGELETG